MRVEFAGTLFSRPVELWLQSLFALRSDSPSTSRVCVHMASFPASFIASGMRVPYHVASRARLSDVTADALRSAAVRLPSDDLRQTGPWFARGHLKFSEARSMLPAIMGGTRRNVDYDVSAGSRGVLLRAAEYGTTRRALVSTMRLDTMGFADPERDGRPSGDQHLPRGAKRGQPIQMVIRPP